MDVGPRQAFLVRILENFARRLALEEAVQGLLDDAKLERHLKLLMQHAGKAGADDASGPVDFLAAGAVDDATAEPSSLPQEVNDGLVTADPAPPAAKAAEPADDTDVKLQQL